MTERKPDKPLTQPTYDRHFGEDRICRCGHSYHAHFYRAMRGTVMLPRTCKYCTCEVWKQP